MTTVARTPSSFGPVASAAALAELEFDRTLETVARWAVSPLGAASVRARRPAADPELVRRETTRVTQLVAALRDEDPFAPEPVPDLAATLDALAAEGSVLEAQALVALGAAVGAMGRTAAGLRRLAAQAPLAAELAVDPPPMSLARAIERALEPDGTVTDDASPALRRARRRVRETRTRLVTRLGQLVRSLPPEAATGETEVRVHQGRYVIPLRRDARARLSGIVHGESGSGTTLFVEPTETVDLGNELAAAQAEEARAVLAVLRDLTAEARGHRHAIGAGFAMCIAAEDLYARAQYARHVDAHPPGIGDPGTSLVIRRGVHPLLLAEARDAVRFDLELGDGRATLVVSGPNAGGKTVLLKAVGLIAALAQAGVLPPVGAGTTLPVFRRIFVDIGDHQSIAASLSTYSAHLAALREILTAADAASLVLLDELGGGTDPAEGAALAGAVLLSLARRGATTVATTHLTPLKELAAGEARFVNASLEFDGETLTPTFRLVTGRPGRSYALVMARRLGLPADVVALADRLLPEQVRSLDAMLAELERREQELARREADADAAAARLARDRNAADRDAATLAAQAVELEARQREIEKTGREQARRFLLEARKRVEEALAIARAAVSEATAKEARRLVEEGVREEAHALKQLEQAAKRKGWRIKGASGERSAGADAAAACTDAPAGASRAHVAPSTPAHRSPLTAHRSPRVEAATDIDLRGMTGDEAEAALVTALDAAVVADLPSLRIIHGKGTGALRARVGEVLARDRRVAAHRLAPPTEGGAGVTIAELGG